jgi:tetratricopeptide (TPR) repeat protein
MRLTLAACLTLPLLTLPALAQAPVTGSGVSQTPSQENTPQLLLVTCRDPKASAHDEATRIAMQDAIIGLMRNTGHYQVTVYSPTQPLIKHALLTHTISSLDLNEPLQPEGMRHLALALGIRTVLFLTPVFDKTGLKMESQLHQNVGQDAWQLAISGDATTPYQYGKRRLNTKEVIALTVDALAARLSLPSHMAADLNLKTMETAMATPPKKPTKGDQARNTAGTKAVQSVPPDTTANPDKTQTSTTTTDTTPTDTVITQPTAPKDPNVKGNGGRAAKADKTNSRTAKVDKTAQGAQTSEEALASPNNRTQIGGINGPDGRTGRADVPIAQTVAHPNYETLADHYHDNHDLANTITWLRYAVNERPRDIPLRHKLIQAYQERKMPESALAEISRALQIAPNDGGLYRFYGETLMNKGEVPAAEKAFRDAVRLNADDIPARIALGDALMLDNQYADALDTYTAAQKADPRSPLPHRRLARVFLMRAAADPTQYAASLDEIAKAQQLTPTNDKNTYQEDYGTLMTITEARLRELLEEISGNFIAMNKGKQSGNDTLRALSDMQIRTDALSDYLDKAPAAQGQDATKIHYQQADTLLLSSITLFKNYLNKNDPAVKQQMQDASAEAYQELDAAHKRLVDIRSALIPK